MRDEVEVETARVDSPAENQVSATASKLRREGAAINIFAARFDDCGAK
jgi:hypothetical protein